MYSIDSCSEDLLNLYVYDVGVIFFSVYIFCFTNVISMYIDKVSSHI